jgi:precorrin-8X/cobalt-precorrin-8 methylmutase
MLSSLNHPILEQSFRIIDQEIGEHSFSPWEYGIVRRIIHATADFELAKQVYFSVDAITVGIESLRQGLPIITDVNMVKYGILSLVEKTFKNPVFAAIDFATTALPGKTRTETGLLRCLEQYPEAIYVFGNAPTALLALCQKYADLQQKPKLIIGAPVGFISVVESKQVLAKIPVPQIRIEGRKGGSPVAAAIINALLVLAYQQ